jgi:hypothetical protein
MNQEQVKALLAGKENTHVVVLRGHGNYRRSRNGAWMGAGYTQDEPRVVPQSEALNWVGHANTSFYFADGHSEHWDLTNTPCRFSSSAGFDAKPRIGCKGYYRPVSHDFSIRLWSEHSVRVEYQSSAAMSWWLDRRAALANGAVYEILTPQQARELKQELELYGFSVSEAKA